MGLEEIGGLIWIRTGAITRPCGLSDTTRWR